MDLKALDEAIQAYIRPATFPVAVTLLREREKVPEKAKIPHRDFGKKFSVCQGWNMCRRYGWSVALGPEDMSCSLGSVAMGFGPVNEYYTEGYMCEEIYTASAEAGKRTEAQTPRFDYNAYRYVVFEALQRTTLQPHLFIIYGNSAQVMRLLHGALFKKGGRLTSSFSGRMDCADLIVATFQTGECQIVLPCYGDRIFGQTQDAEMAFTIPAHRVEDVIEGLKGTHKGGVRYPVPSYINFEATFPEKYTKLFEIWGREGSGGGAEKG